MINERIQEAIDSMDDDALRTLYFRNSKVLANRRDNYYRMKTIVGMMSEEMAKRGIGED